MSIYEDTELRELVRKLAIINAVKHGGKAEAGPVIGKILGEKAELRAKTRELSRLVDSITKEINDLSLNQQQEIVAEKWPETLLKEKTQEEKKLPPLPNADRFEHIVTRFSPNPDCAIHLGNARAIILCHEYALMYKGKFILRFEDTDPKVKRPVLEFYDRIREDLNWLDCKPDEEYIQSDRISIYYEYAQKLLNDGNAYVCLCGREQSHKRLLNRQPCECRDLPPKENLLRWQNMLEGHYEEGQAVLRVKTDLNHPNPAVRDWPAARIIDIEKYPHPRVGTKYHVWPLYNLACGIDDHLLGVTHIIRGKEHLTNQVRQEFMYKHLEWKYPEAIHYGRLKITGAYLSKSKIVEGIREGRFKDWDDPRLATFAALRRRGITPEAIKKMIIDVGPKSQDVTLSWENLYAYNRKILDPTTERYFFVQDPIELTVTDFRTTFHVRLNLHPDHSEKGFREYTIEPEKDNTAKFWVSKRDIEPSRVGSIMRLMELFNVRIEKANVYAADAIYVSEPYEEAKQSKAQLIHWIPIGRDMPCEVTLQDATVTEGIAEDVCKRLNPGRIIQFERFGFVRIDQNDRKLTAYYSHK